MSPRAPLHPKDAGTWKSLLDKGLPRRYLTPAVAPSGKALYYHPDHLGSTAFTTDADGSVVSETRYYPFGLLRLRTGTDPEGADYLYTDHELDSESGLVYANARYRDPVIGRFVSVDPLLVETPDKCGIQECNLYSYSKNNVISFFDSLSSFSLGVHQEIAEKATKRAGISGSGRCHHSSRQFFREFDIH